MDINYIKHDKINFFKWDRCIDRAINGNIFGYSWYLNIVCDTWDALVKGDYESVMPIPLKKIFGIEKIDSPKLSPELGIFSVKYLDRDLINAFISNIPNKFKSYKIYLNKFNPVKQLPNYKPRLVYEMDLILPYERLLEDYHAKTKLKLEKAKENKVSIVKGMMPNDFIGLIKNSYTSLRFQTGLDDYSKLRIIASTTIKYRLGQLYAAYTAENNLCAASLFLWSHRKVTMLYSAADKEGVKNHALEFIANTFIKEHSTYNLTIGFENIGLYKGKINYAGFGAKPFKHYCIIKRRKIF